MSQIKHSCWLLIPAAGVGSRMGLGHAKQYMPLLGKPMLAQTVAPFLACEFVAGITIALAEGDTSHTDIELLQHPKIKLCIGGDSRADSVLAGLNSLDAAKAEDWVMVHDAARPCVTTEQLQHFYDTLSPSEHGGIWAIPQADTLKRVNNGVVETTVDRNNIWCAQTPQMFRYNTLKQALHAALTAGITITDEASALEAAGIPVKIVQGHSQNIKATYPSDAALAAFYLENRAD